MSFADRVKAATGPAEAMLVIALGIDAILDVLDDQAHAKVEADPWGQWDNHAVHVDLARAYVEGGTKGDAEYTVVQPADPKPDNTVAIAAVKAAMETETDGENLLALEAKLRLLTDTGEEPFRVTEGNRIEADADGQIDLPLVDAARREARFAWAKGHRLGDLLDPPMDIIEAANAYAKGGPMWLYLPAREVIMQMPEEWRRMMVEDVERDSPAQAQEMSRDVLKDFEPGTPDITVETMANQLRKG